MSQIDTRAWRAGSMKDMRRSHLMTHAQRLLSDFRFWPAITGWAIFKMGGRQIHPIFSASGGGGTAAVTADPRGAMANVYLMLTVWSIALLLPLYAFRMFSSSATEAGFTLAP